MRIVDLLWCSTWRNHGLYPK